MPNTKVLKKTKDQIKDEKMWFKEMEEYEADFNNLRTLLFKIEVHYDKIEPNYHTEENSFYNQGLTEADFNALLTDMNYPISQLEKFIVWQWMEKNSEGLASYRDLIWSTATKFKEFITILKEKEDFKNALCEAQIDMKWVAINFLLDGFTVLKMSTHTFSKIVPISVTGLYLRNVIRHTVDKLPSKVVVIFTDKRNKHDSIIHHTATIASLGYPGGTKIFPQEIIFYYDFIIEKFIFKPILDNVNFIKRPMPKIKNMDK